MTENVLRLWDVHHRMPEETISVEGMSCSNCEQAVETAVAALEGAEAVDADNATGTVEIDGEVDPTDVADAIEEAGYVVLG